MNDSPGISGTEKLDTLVSSLVAYSSAVDELEEMTFTCGAFCAAGWIVDTQEALPVAIGEAMSLIESAIAIGFAGLSSSTNAIDFSSELFREGFLAMVTAYPTFGFVLLTEGP